MARSTPSPVEPTYAGTVVTPTAPNADGDIIDPGATLVVICGGTGTTVTVDVTSNDDLGRPLPDAGGAVAANTTRLFKIPPKRVAGQPPDATVGSNKVLVNYSSVATVTRYVLAP